MCKALMNKEKPNTVKIQTKLKESECVELVQGRDLMMLEVVGPPDHSKRLLNWASLLFSSI